MIRYKNLLKSSRAFRLFSGDCARQTVSHSYLLISGDSDALIELVKLFAATLNCTGLEKPCLECSECKKYSELSGGNVLLYPKGDRIKKDDVTDLIQNISYKSFESGAKIAILKDADNMDANTQNKLLKTLEEPPENTILFLLASNKDKLLPTIRSRARIIELEEFSAEDIYKDLSERFGAGERLSRACASASGKPGLAEKFYSDPHFEKVLNFTEQMINGLQTSGDFLKFSSRFDEIKGDYELFLDLLLTGLRDAMTKGLTRALSCQKEFPDAPPEAFAEAIEYVNLCKKKIVSNCNAGAAYQMLILKLLQTLNPNRQ